MSTPTPAPDVVVISGRFVDSVRRPASGIFTITLVSVIADNGDRVVLTPSDIDVDLDGFGSFVISIPVPVVQGYDAAGLIFQFTESITGFANASYFAAVTLKDGRDEVDIADVSPTGRAVGSLAAGALSKLDASLLYATQASLNALISALAQRTALVETGLSALDGLDEQLDLLDGDIDDLDRTKADLDYVNTELNKLVTITRLVDELALRPSKAYVDGKVAGVAYAVDVTSGLNNKLDKSEFYAFTGGSSTTPNPAASREEIIVEAVTRSVAKVNTDVVPPTLLKARNTAFAFDMMHMGA